VCGRFTLTWDQWRRVADRLGLSDDGGLDASYRPRWNIAPTDEHFIVTSRFERRVAQRTRRVDPWTRVAQPTEHLAHTFIAQPQATLRSHREAARGHLASPFTVRLWV
jgi:hypothetical protein